MLLYFILGILISYATYVKTCIKDLCTKVIWLDHGKIVKMGDPKEICDEYYKKQMSN